MATKRLLVDAIHPEETRIVVTNGNRLEEFDFESATRRQLRGNIYLAKVTRVEPSLQAAFIEYGGNRHGFLAFSEIHPDYYQIPVADREALMREEEEEDAAEEAAAEADADEAAEKEAAAADATVAPSVEEPAGDAGAADAEAADSAAVEASADNGEDVENGDDGNGRGHVEEAPAESEPVESVGSGDALEELRERPRRSSPSRRAYKIQEVIKRRQVMLVQVVKEERGNKGAALTTYLSLAGRYSVLMPNTARGGGISRKITNAADRKRLKDIVGDLDIPPGQGIILRTAGASRTKAEVKRDFEYLQRLWENVRSLTLRSTAPCLVYEEGSLIKRTIRDLYSKDIDEVFVAGEEAYREAKDFMRMIMPSHAKNVQVYKDDQPIFSRYGVESQLDSMFSPQVTLPSGGYLVINPTEALVSIDVNSGRATKEHNIEDTALQTNLEAAEEIARQLRLRDLAGLIVIDFIDMVENRSNRAVERKLKDCLKNDRARIQVGRISHFGLMEMSRQRIRFGVIESSTHKCPVCAGTGIVRSTESIALMVMRAVEDHVLRKPGQSINVRVPTDVALYILNGKRNTLNQLEEKYALSITLVADDHIPGAHYAIERGEPRFATDVPPPSHVRVDSAIIEPEVEEEADEEVEDEAAEASAENGGDRQGRRRRRRRGRGGERDLEARQPQPQRVETEAADEGDEDGEAEPSREPHEAVANHEDGEEPRRRRRRGRRGGRRNRRPETEESALGPHGDADAGTTEEEAAPADVVPEAETGVEAPPEAAPEVVDEVAASLLGQPEPAAEVAEVAEEEPKPKRARRRRTAASAEAGEAGEVRPSSRRGRSKAAPPSPEQAADSAAALADMTGAPIATAEPEAELALEQPAAAPEPAAVAPEATEPSRRRKELPPDEIVVSSTAQPGTEDRPKRGWWQRGFFGS